MNLVTSASPRTMRIDSPVRNDRCKRMIPHSNVRHFVPISIMLFIIQLLSLLLFLHETRRNGVMLVHAFGIIQHPYTKVTTTSIQRIDDIVRKGKISNTVIIQGQTLSKLQKYLIMSTYHRHHYSNDIICCYNTNCNDDDTMDETFSSCTTIDDDVGDGSSGINNYDLLVLDTSSSLSSSSSYVSKNKSTFINLLTSLSSKTKKDNSNIDNDSSNTYNVNQVERDINVRYNDRYSNKNSNPLSTTTSTSTINLDIVGNIQKFLDTISDGWVLSYANLYPDTPQTMSGQLFLFTNICYMIIGILFIQSYDNIYFGILSELVAVLSFNYHYQQLLNVDVNAVRLSLLCDYIGALTIILIGLYYVIMQPLLLYLSLGYNNITSVDLQSLQFECVICSIVSMLFLLSSWIYEAGKPYMTFHGIWHIASAYTGYLIGTYHYQFIMETTDTTTSIL